MSRQQGFEKLYAKMHDIDPEDLVQYRFGSKDGYRLPQMASHYRLYCETLDSLAVDFPDSPGHFYNGAPSSALADPMQCWWDGYKSAVGRVESAGIKVAI